MSETITLSGTTFTLAGGFSSLQDDLQARIEQGGGKVQVKLGARVDVVVAGRGAGDTLRHARYQGVPVIGEAELERLLAGEEIEAVFETPEVFDEGALLSELRGLLNTSADSDAWPQLVRLLDRCAPALMDTAVHYASTYLDRIDAAARGPLLTTHDGYAWIDTPAEVRLEGTRDWADKMPTLMRWRPAPLHWIGQLSQGARSPKFRLINGLYFHGAKLSAGQVAAALANPELTGVRALGLGYKCRYGKVIFKALCESEALQQLDTLILDHDAQGMEHAGLLAEQDALPALRHLSLQNIYVAREHTPIVELGCGAWAERLETLELHPLIQSWHRNVFGTPTLQRRIARELAPNARRLLIQTSSTAMYQQPVDTDQQWWGALRATLARAEAFGIADVPDALVTFSQVFESSGRFGELGSLQALDLSRISMTVTRRHARSDPDTAEAGAWRRLANTALAKYAGRVWLAAHQRHAARHFEAFDIEVADAPLPCQLT